MENYRLIYTEEAANDLQRIRGRHKVRLKEVLMHVKAFPHVAHDASEVSDDGRFVYYRRSGAFRIRYLIEDAVKEVRILEILQVK